MYRVIKALNNNGILALDEKNRETILLGKGIGFAKKTGERIDKPASAKVYLLLKGNGKAEHALTTVNDIDPKAVEMAARLLDLAKNRFPAVRDDILLPMADHLQMAFRRKKTGARLPNPLQHDIMAMFPEEYAVARDGLVALATDPDMALPEEEAAYLSLHIHAGISETKAGESLQTLELASRLIEKIEAKAQLSFVRASLKYTRLVSHVCYMIQRVKAQEKVSVDLSAYIEASYPKAWKIAVEISAILSTELSLPVEKNEIGLLALHIQRVL